MKKFCYRIVAAMFIAAMSNCIGMDQEEKLFTAEEFLKDYPNLLHHAGSFDVRENDVIVAVGRDCVCTAETFVADGIKKCKIRLYQKNTLHGAWEETQTAIYKNLIPVGIRIVEDSERKQTIVILGDDLGDLSPSTQSFFQRFFPPEYPQCFIKLNIDTLQEISFSNIHRTRLYTKMSAPLSDDQFDIFADCIVYASDILPLKGKYSPHQNITMYSLNGKQLGDKSVNYVLSDSPIKKIRICNANSAKGKVPVALVFCNKCTAYSANNFPESSFQKGVFHFERFSFKNSNHKLSVDSDLDCMRESLFERGNCYAQSEGKYSQLKIGNDNKIEISSHFFGEVAPHTSPLFGTISIESMQSYDEDTVLRIEKPGFFTSRRATLFHKRKQTEKKKEDDENITATSNNYIKSATFPITFHKAKMLSNHGVLIVNDRKLHFFDTTASESAMNEVITASRKEKLPSLEKQVNDTIIQTTKKNESWWWGTAKKLVPIAIAAGVTYVGYKGLQQLKQKQK